ncbi:MAG: zinc ribbon domain-containing protein [Planctomycetia bacterium]|nr:zinc ribbon domain-containing protein [Planctomycetia bacterium]
MPTYEYRCGACGVRFERFQRMSDEPLRDCPECGASAARRLMSTGGGIVFKGHGFYVTDYRGASYTKAESAEKTNVNAAKGDSKKGDTAKEEPKSVGGTTSAEDTK